MRKNLRIEGLGGELVTKVSISADSLPYTLFEKANRVRAKAKGTTHHVRAQELYLKTVRLVDTHASSEFDKQNAN